MIAIKRIEQGKILYENFKNDINITGDGWFMYPSNNRFIINKTDFTLDMLHGDEPAYLLRALPESAVIEINNTYNPVHEYDMGGLVAYASDNHKLELYEYFNPEVGTALAFPYVRLIKKGCIYEGYGSQDGENWDIRGVAAFEQANKWGICLEGRSGEIMKLHKLSIYKETNIYLKALPLGGMAEAWRVDGTNQILIDRLSNTSDEMEINIFNLPMPVHALFRIYDKAGILVSEQEFNDIFGGDVFYCDNYLEVYYNDKSMSVQNDASVSPALYYKDFKLMLKNKVNVSQENINIEIKKYHEQYGWIWLDVCNDINGVPRGDYRKSITIDKISEEGSTYFWVRARSTTPIQEDYLFDFIINTW